MNNILYLHNHVEIGGGERSLLELFRFLDRKAFRPHVLLPCEGPFVDELKRLEVGTDFLAVPQIRLINAFSIPAVLSRLRTIVREKSVDLIHSYSPRNNLVASAVGRMCRIPVIWHERNLLMKNERDVTRKFLAVPDRVICNSEAVAGRFSGRPRAREKTVIIHNGVDTEVFFPGPKPQEAVNKYGLQNKICIGMAANLNPVKRIDYLIDVAAEVLKIHKDIVFLLAGGEFTEGSRKGKGFYENLLRERKIEGRFIMTGFQRDMRQIYNLLDIFLHVGIREACSRAILEAMACGKPAVAMNDGGNPELIDDGLTGILVSPDDKERLVREILSLAEDEPRRKRMGDSATKRVKEHFDIRAQARQTEGLYKELMGDDETRH